jgi:hypothetical protein
MKQKMEAQAIFLNPFTVANHADGSLSFVLLLPKKQTVPVVIRLQTDGTDLPIYAESSA